MTTHKIAVIAGDGIGPEVIDEGIKVLNKVAELDGSFCFEFTHFPWGCEFYREHGKMMDDDGIDIEKLEQALKTEKNVRLIYVIPTFQNPSGCTMSMERRKLIAAYGAEVVLTPGAEGMNGCIEKAEQLHAENPGSVIAGQFYNPHNPEAHYLSTGPEIWEDTEGKVDILVCTVGTGGTISGTGRYLKERKPGIKVVAVEPDASPLLSGGTAAVHGIQGIGANFIPEALDRSVYDEVFRCTDEDAFKAMRALAKTDGVLCGISSGAALHAAACIGKKPENAGKNIVVLLPDSGERYLSTDLYG